MLKAPGALSIGRFDRRFDQGWSEHRNRGEDRSAGSPQKGKKEAMLWGVRDKAHSKTVETMIPDVCTGC
jgi:hypothetical protein